MSVKANQFMKMNDVKVLAQCLLLDDLKIDRKFVLAKMYTLKKNKISGYFKM